MTPPRESGFRRPAVAGRFYPADANQCRTLASQYVEAGKRKNRTVVTRGTGVTTGVGGETAGGRLIGGIVPHAGWICSGAIAGETIGALASAQPEADLVVVFGAIHTPIPTRAAALDSHAKWIEPGAETAVVEDVRAGLAEKKDAFVVDDRFHVHEHAVEVELPLIEIAWPAAAILPVEVPPAMNAIDIGRETAKRCMAMNRRPVFLASSDLTHYGPNYGFAPAGIGEAGLEWAKANDRRLLAMIETFDIDNIVPEVAMHMSACGGGAIAAMLAAGREYGAGSATVLTHASSYETLREVAPQRPDNAVGYAAVVVK